MFEVSREQSVDQIYRQIEEEYSPGFTPAAGAALGYHRLHLTVKQ